MKQQESKFKKGDRVIILSAGSIATEMGVKRGDTGTVNESATTPFVVVDGIKNHMPAFCCKRLMLISDWEKLPEVERLLWDYDYVDDRQ